MQVSWADYDEDEELALVADPWADVDGRTAAVSADDQPTPASSQSGRITGSACATVSISANDLPTVGAEDSHEFQAAGTDEHQTANANEPQTASADKQSRTWVDVVGRATAANVNELYADTELSITHTRTPRPSQQSIKHTTSSSCVLPKGSRATTKLEVSGVINSPTLSSCDFVVADKAVQKELREDVRGLQRHPTTPPHCNVEIGDKSVGNAEPRTWADVVGHVGEQDEPQFQRQETYEPGEYVGIRAVHSILMSATQMNLSHFHTAGMHSSLPSSRPVPSPAEALNDVYVNTSMTFESSDNVHTLRKHIVGANLSSFVKSVKGSFTWLPDQENVWYEVLQQPMYDGNIIRLYIQFEKMRNHGLTLRDLADTSFGTDVVTHVSPDFMGMIDIEVPNDHLSQWLSRMGTPVCGTPKVKSCEKVGKTAVTYGTNVLTLSKVSTVNSKTITSNDVNEVLMLYGIEAAAAVLYDLTKSPVVSDFMARTGRVLYFTKNSLEVARKGLLTSMGFERPKNDIKDALIRPHMYNSHRPSVKESIITGTRAACDFEIYQ